MQNTDLEILKRGRNGQGRVYTPHLSVVVTSQSSFLTLLYAKCLHYCHYNARVSHPLESWKVRFSDRVNVALTDNSNRNLYLFSFYTNINNDMKDINLN